MSSINKVLKLLRVHFAVSMTADQEFSTTDMDSLDLYEMLMILEDEFLVIIPEGMLSDMKTPQKFAEYLDAKSATPRPR